MDRRKIIRKIFILGAGVWMVCGVFFYFHSDAMAEWGDLILEKTYDSMKTSQVKKVLFPHWFHRIRYKCKACHDSLFKMERGGNNITMSSIINGKGCGKCHDGTVAFAPLDCDRCHSYDERTVIASAYNTASVSHTQKTEAIKSNPVKTQLKDNPGDKKEGFIEKEEDEDASQNIFAQLNSKRIMIDPNSSVYLSTKGDKASTGRPGEKAGLAAKIGSLEKVPALKDIKKDKFGLIDWVAAVKEQKITPVAGVDPVFNKDKFEEWVQVFKSKSDFIEDVPFPHDIHTYLVDCDSCHPKPFVDKEGKNPDVRMSEMKNGAWCGKCHSKIAFSLDDCKRCHTRPKEKELASERTQK